MLGSSEFAVRPDGSLYVAHFNFAQLVKLDGRTGERIESIDRPPGSPAVPAVRAGRAPVCQHHDRYGGDDGRFLGEFYKGPDLFRPGAMVFVPEPAGAVAGVAVSGLLVARRRRRHVRD